MLLYSLFLSNISFAYNDVCRIQWDSHVHGYLTLETNYSHDFEIVSLIVDDKISNYNWTIPWYITQYWKQDYQFSLTNLETGQIDYSNYFKIDGITLTSYEIAPNIFNISWTSNIQEEVSLELLDNKLPIFTIVEKVPSIYSYLWEAPSISSTHLQFKVTNGESYAHSHYFIMTTTTTPTSTLTSSVLNILEHNYTNVLNIEDNSNIHIILIVGIVVVFLVVIISGLLLYRLYCKNNKVYSTSSKKVKPSMSLTILMKDSHSQPLPKRLPPIRRHF